MWRRRFLVRVHFSILFVESGPVYQFDISLDCGRRRLRVHVDGERVQFHLFFRHPVERHQSDDLVHQRDATLHNNLCREHRRGAKCVRHSNESRSWRRHIIGGHSCGQCSGSSRHLSFAFLCQGWRCRIYADRQWKRIPYLIGDPVEWQ